MRDFVAFNHLTSTDITCCVIALSRVSAIRIDKQSVITLEVLPQLLQRANYLKEKFTGNQITEILGVVKFAHKRDRDSLIDMFKDKIINNKISSLHASQRIIGKLSREGVPDEVMFKITEKYFNSHSDRIHDLIRILSSSQKSKNIKTHKHCIELLSSITSSKLSSLDEEDKLCVLSVLSKSRSVLPSDYVLKSDNISINIIKLDIPTSAGYLPKLFRQCKQILQSDSRHPTAPYINRLLERNYLTISKTFKELLVGDVITVLQSYCSQDGKMLSDEMVKPALRKVFMHTREKVLPLPTAAAFVSFINIWLSHSNRGKDMGNPRLQQLIKKHSKDYQPIVTADDNFINETRELSLVADIINDSRIQINSIIKKTIRQQRIDPWLTKRIINLVYVASQFDSGKLLFCQVMSPLVIPKFTFPNWEILCTVASMNKKRMGRWVPDTIRIKKQLCLVIDQLIEKCKYKPSIKQMSNLLLDLNGCTTALPPKLSWELTMHVGTELNRLSEAEILVAIRAAVTQTSMRDVVHMLLPHVISRTLSKKFIDSIKIILIRSVVTEEIKEFLNKLPQ